MTRLVLANAIYFRASWATEFDPRLTHDATFHRADGSTVTVPMMHDSGDYAYSTSDPLAKVVELPYRDDEVSMLLIVPQAVDGLPAVEAAVESGWLDAQTLQGPYELELGLPRFTTRWHASLVQPLENLGMTDAFDPVKADLSGVADDALYVQSAEHSAYVKVDEQGTTAAAATGFGSSSSSAPPSIVADHPFLFVIRDKLTGTLLFIGRIEDPTAE